MKQLKFILLSAIAVVTINSCSSDRDEEVKQESATKLELKPLKIEKSNNQETSKTGDTVIVGTSTTTTTLPTIGLDPEPNPNPDPNEGGDPKGLPPRH